jgi:hypothetical protein
MSTRDTITLDQDQDWSAVKLPPRLTGLPMAVWITEDEGYQHDVRVKVSAIHGGRGSWRTAPSIGVRPRPHEIVPGGLLAADVALVGRWITLNRDIIIAFWDGQIDADEVLQKLQKLSP